MSVVAAAAGGAESALKLRCYLSVTVQIRP